MGPNQGRNVMLPPLCEVIIARKSQGHLAIQILEEGSHGWAAARGGVQSFAQRCQECL